MESAPTQGSGAADAVVRGLLQNPYPKIGRKVEEKKERAKFTSTDYSCKDRLFMGGPFYTRIALVSFRSFLFCLSTHSQIHLIESATERLPSGSASICLSFLCKKQQPLRANIFCFEKRADARPC